MPVAGLKIAVNPWLQVLCNTFLGSRANDMVRNRLLTALGELMRVTQAVVLP